MGFLNLEREPEHMHEIQKALEKRGLRFDVEDDWEIHGPHPNMDYQVYVGTAYKDTPNGSEEMYVAIYPHAVYQIDDSDEWQTPSSEQRIFIK
jgi:hypothetical protein